MLYALPTAFQPMLEHDRDDARGQQRAQQIRVDAFHPAGALIVDAVHHTRGARPYPVAYHGAGAALGEQRQQLVDDAGRTPHHGGHVRFRGDAALADAGRWRRPCRQPRGRAAQRRVDGVPGARHQHSLDSHALQEHDVLDQHREQRRAEQVVLDPQDEQAPAVVAQVGEHVAGRGDGSGGGHGVIVTAEHGSLKGPRRPWGRASTLPPLLCYLMGDEPRHDRRRSLACARGGLGSCCSA